jgi:hypothetical protein
VLKSVPVAASAWCRCMHGIMAQPCFACCRHLYTCIPHSTSPPNIQFKRVLDADLNRKLHWLDTGFLSCPAYTSTTVCRALAQARSHIQLPLLTFAPAFNSRPQQRLGLISAPEALISRRTACVPLLRLLRPSLAGAAWPGGRVAPMHTDVGFWQPAAG